MLGLQRTVAESISPYILEVAAIFRLRLRNFEEGLTQLKESHFNVARSNKLVNDLIKLSHC
jgi:hypothetical protein